MVTSDMQRAADLPSRCCLFNNCVQFTSFYMQRFTTVLLKMQTSTFFVIKYSDGKHKKQCEC